MTMRIDKKGLPIHKDATFKIRPRIFLEGNFFVDVQPGLAVARRRSATATDPDQPDQRAGPARPGPQRAAGADTRKDLQALLRRALDRASTGRAARGYNRSIPYWKPAYRDGAIVADALAGHRRPRPRRATSRTPAPTAAGARPQPRAAQVASITDFDTTAARVRRRATSSSRHAVAELPRTLQRRRCPRCAPLNAAFPPCARLIRDARPAVRSVGPGARREHARSSGRPAASSSKPELRGLVARPAPARARR